jgi:hypothetical protein
VDIFSASVSERLQQTKNRDRYHFIAKLELKKIAKLRMLISVALLFLARAVIAQSV